MTTEIDAGAAMQADDDLDSSLGDEVASSTESLSSSIRKYRHENGRTYHAYGDEKYYLPNDEAENDRLDMQHELFRLTYGGDRLGLAPPCLPDAKVYRVLDIGTGTGIWAIDYGDEHHEAQVTGVDLSPIQPIFVPLNVCFVIDDIDNEWKYSKPFDYVHSRMMNSCIEDWSVFLRNIYDNLAPGGYVEVQDISCEMASDDDTVNPNSKLVEWCNLLKEACAKLGRPFVTFDQMRKHMDEAGFVDIVDKRFKWPTNNWPKDRKYKELGMWNNENTTLALDSLTLAPFTRVHGWSQEEVTIFLAGVRNELNNPKIHAYWPICSIYGRKPDAA